MARNKGLRTRKQIKADNEAFEKLSPARKRVAIIRDALAQLGSRLVPEHKTYVSAPEIAHLLRENPNAQLQQAFNKMEECSVCAKGALFVCLVDRANALKITDLQYDTRSNGTFDGKEVDTYLPNLFSENQLELIETAFEGRAYGSTLSTTNSFSALGAAREFYELFKYSTDEEDTKPETILRAIFENMVANKGTFKPEIQPVKRWVTEGFRG